MANSNTKEPNVIERLRYKYRLVIMNEDTFEEYLSFMLSKLNIYIALSTVFVCIVFLVSLLIVLTPLKEYIPGYGDEDVRRKALALVQTSDSLENVVYHHESYIANIKDILYDRIDTTQEEIVDEAEDEIVLSDSINLDYVSPSEINLRDELEGKQNSLYSGVTGVTGEKGLNKIEDIALFPPVVGFLTDAFNPDEEHFGVDIVAPENEAIKSVTDGIVILASWTVETGHVIGVQHKSNLISFYKHNSVLLKKVGDVVTAGEAVAIIGDSGEKTTGPHLHFELWYDQAPINPTNYISFNWDYPF